MENLKVQFSKPHITIGNLGHVDTGKTALISAILKMLCQDGLPEKFKGLVVDKAPEEKERTIFINFSIEYFTEKRHYTHLDSSGHRDSVNVIINDVQYMDGAILVISAVDGIMPQTREHLLIARQLNLKKIVVFINKVELVDDCDILETIELEIRDLLNYYNFEGDKTPVIFGSALGALNNEKKWLDKINELIFSIDDWIQIPKYEYDKPFLMLVDRVYYQTSWGTVASGRIKSGIICTGDSVNIVGWKNDIIKSEIRGVEMFGKIFDNGAAGDLVGLLLKGVGKWEIRSGMFVIKQNSISTHIKFKANIYILKEEEGGLNTPIFNKTKIFTYFTGIPIESEIQLQEGTDMVMSGDNCSIVICLINPTFIAKGMSFLIRNYGRTSGVGDVTEIIE